MSKIDAVNAVAEKLQVIKDEYWGGLEARSNMGLTYTLTVLFAIAPLLALGVQFALNSEPLAHEGFYFVPPIFILVAYIFSSEHWFLLKKPAAIITNIVIGILIGGLVYLGHLLEPTLPISNTTLADVAKTLTSIWTFIFPLTHFIFLKALPFIFREWYCSKKSKPVE